MNNEEALAIIKEFRNWNYGQKSVGYAFGGARTTEDDIYDVRRDLILKAHQQLNDPTGFSSQENYTGKTCTDIR